jgi:hypothetical protein
MPGEVLFSSVPQASAEIGIKPLEGDFVQTLDIASIDTEAQIITVKQRESSCEEGGVWDEGLSLVEVPYTLSGGKLLLDADSELRGPWTASALLGTWDMDSEALATLQEATQSEEGSAEILSGSISITETQITVTLKTQQCHAQMWLAAKGDIAPFTVDGCRLRFTQGADTLYFFDTPFEEFQSHYSSYGVYVYQGKYCAVLRQYPYNSSMTESMCRDSWSYFQGQGGGTGFYYPSAYMSMTSAQNAPTFEACMAQLGIPEALLSAM